MRSKKVRRTTCRSCRKPLIQPKTGRPRLYCSKACRAKGYRIAHGRMTRDSFELRRIVRVRRSKPMAERSFDASLQRSIKTLSPRREVYECLACGTPYIVERISTGGTQRRFCSGRCARMAKLRWRKLHHAIDEAGARGELVPGVKQRLALHKLSPLCPQCGKPFVPNTDLYGFRKRGRPRKYCSDRCRNAAFEYRWKVRYRRARVHRTRLCPNCGRILGSPAFCVQDRQC